MSSRTISTCALLLTCSHVVLAADSESGSTIFHTRWFATNEAQPHAFSGLGPLFNAVSCAACHGTGGGSISSIESGTVPTALVVQLESPQPDGNTGSQPQGDPVYGRVFSAAALAGVKAEGTVLVQYTQMIGHYYPDGIRWRLRIPEYRFANLAHGPIASTTIIKPRLAPPLFGTGLLESVVLGSTDSNPGPVGRFGWQMNAISIRDQSAKALALEMGITSIEYSHDDCTAFEADCERISAGTQLEITKERLDALVQYVHSLPIPKSPHRYTDAAPGSALFDSIGCQTCHRRSLSGGIEAYTDLQLHDLGPDMADANAAGHKLPSRWRTAPLWGLGSRIGSDGEAALLHDGRARSPEEAILWHGGEAAHSRVGFLGLGPRSRQALLHFLETL